MAIAVMALFGVIATAGVSLIGHLLTRQASRRLTQEHEDERERLRLDAAMRAGMLLAGADGVPADRAAAASGLLALTRLGHAELAVALLVDLWSNPSDRDAPGQVSTETAVLVIDAALTADRANAQLVAAELLCRNALRLDSCQSLHWPSAVDGRWIPGLSPKAKLLILDALVTMAVNGRSNENALRSIAVRLYGIGEGDPSDRVKGCVGTLVQALLPALRRLRYDDMIQGPAMVTLRQLEGAGAAASKNPDGYLERIVADRSRKLEAWSATGCDEIDLGVGSLGTGACDCPRQPAGA
jgi:hypothetical protein